MAGRGGVISCSNIDRRAARGLQRAAAALRAGVAVIEGPVDLDARRRRVAAVVVH